MNPTEQFNHGVSLNGPAPPCTGLRQIPWRLSHVVIGLTPFLAVHLVALTVPLRVIPVALGLPVALLGYAWMLVYPLAVARRYGWLPRLSLRPATFVAEALIALFTVAATWGLLAAGYTVWQGVIGEPHVMGNPLVGATLSSNPVFLAAIVVLACACAPLVEEVFFRGLLYNALSRSMPQAGAVAIQAVAFGLMHAAYGTAHAVATGISGAGFALVYSWRQTLLTPVLCHTIHNTAAASIALVTLGWTTDPPALGIDAEPYETSVVVTKVWPGSGAERAGIREGDVLYSVNNFGVRNAQDVRLAINDKKPGGVIPVEYIRDGELNHVEVVLSSRRALSK